MWRDVIELVQPTRMWWDVTGPQGTARIAVDIDLMGSVDASHPFERVGQRWWSAAWAPLITQACVCSSFGTASLITGVDNSLFSAPGMQGAAVGTTSSRVDSVCITAQSKSPNSFGRRRFYVPFIPRSWHNGNVLNDPGFSALLTTMRALVLGCDGDRGGEGPRLIVYRKEQIADRWNTYHPPQWLPVDQLIVNSYLERAPVR